MKITVVGSRDFKNYNVLENVVDNFIFENFWEDGPTEEIVIVSGGAEGADTFAHDYAVKRKLPIVVIKPNWNFWGRQAGFIRNSLIAAQADIILAFYWKEISNGTFDTVTKGKALGKPCIEYFCNEYSVFKVRKTTI